MILPVIMAGGSGSRLWPLSRTHYPKQFHCLVKETSLLIDTFKRLDNLQHKEPLIICNEEHRFLVAEQLRSEKRNTSGIILEPQGRNTCPAIALAAFYASRHGDDPYLLILAADHAIGDEDKFIDSISTALACAANDKLVTFGIVPTAPETGYGYIKKGNKIANCVFKVDSFKEKPCKELAQSYLESGDFLWNSGMFLFKASIFLNELKIKEPEIYSQCLEAIINSHSDSNFTYIDHAIFSQCKDVSVDYAIMEKTDKCAVVPMNANWSDVGSWSSLWEISSKDSMLNHTHGDVIAIDSKRNYIRSESAITATLGVNDLIIVNTHDALLVANRESVQDVKKIISELKKDNRRELSLFKNEYRPWGEIERIDKNDGYIVNRITISPGANISKQVHYHRSEHWIVVSGTAKVTIEDDLFILTENESTFIRAGQMHSITNPGIVPLIIIEIQAGSYISDADIYRIAEGN
ncbi:TPA: mannose-1-phosphate guanylyltransferase/mannose-6-phosphate isomerase [Escherichia coli]|nr:mannose-1-phosphate guanylyltransferase/mannose-6-phosphate isomerase [Escherichia coli]